MRIMSLNPTFKSVIPVKKIVIGDDSSNNSQLRINLDNPSVTTEVSADCTPEDSKKILQTLCRVLAKNDGDKIPQKQVSLYNMLRRSVSRVDKSYKLPAQKMESDYPRKPKPCYTEGMYYVLTGDEAAQYYARGKGIGQSKALVRDFDAPEVVIDYANYDFGTYKKDIIENKAIHLQNNIGMPIGMIIYADRIPPKGKSKADSFNIASVDFEYM